MLIGLYEFLARLAGFEPATLGFVVRYSIQMSYRRLLTGPNILYIHNRCKFFLIHPSPTSCLKILYLIFSRPHFRPGKDINSGRMPGLQLGQFFSLLIE